MKQPRWFGVALLALAAGLSAVAVLGPLVLGVIRYRYTETMLNQATGLDAFALVVVAPIAVAAAVLSFRQRPVAPFLALAPTSFSVYMLVQYVIGPEYLEVAGNQERFFALFAALFVLAAAVLLEAWSLTASLTPAAGSAAWTSRSSRRRGVLLLAFCVFVIGGMYVSNGFFHASSDFPEYVTDRASSSEYDDHPTAFWLVAFLDLAIVVPLTAATGVALVRGRSWARRAYFAVLGWYALVPGSVAAMAIVMVARDDPAADAGRAAVITAAAIVFLALAARSLGTLTRAVTRRDEAPSGGRGIVVRSGSQATLRTGS